MRRMQLVSPLFGAVFALVAQTAAIEAAILSYEGFDYPNDGSPLLNGRTGGTGWAGPWTFTGVAATNNAGFNVSQDDVSLNTSAYPLTPVGDRVLAAGAGTGANSAQADRLFATPFGFGGGGNRFFS